MHRRQLPFLFIFASQLGFAVVVLIAFVAGVFWGTSGFSPVQRDDDDGFPGDFGSAKRLSQEQAEPEDFYPVAEFRNQAGLLIGCYDQLNKSPQLYVDLARALDRRLPVFGLVSSSEQAEAGRKLLHKHGLPADAMYFLPFSGNSIWVRDYGPFMVRRDDNTIVMVDAKYQTRSSRESRKRDEDMAVGLSQLIRLPMRSIPLVLEGGNILSNGDGVLVTSTRTFQYNREFRFDEQHLAELLNEFLGIRKTFVLMPLEGEPTGHVDMFVSILAKNIAVVGEISPESDPVNSSRLDAGAEYLSRISTTLGPMKVFRIPMPPKAGGFWRSYTNIIMANGILVMPSFSDVSRELEDRAEEVYRSILPGWEIKRVVCDSLVIDNGQLHCISYNIPAYVSLDGIFAKLGTQPSEPMKKSNRVIFGKPDAKRK